jgi:hypothetical protein
MLGLVDGPQHMYIWLSLCHVEETIPLLVHAPIELYFHLLDRCFR